MNLQAPEAARSAWSGELYSLAEYPAQAYTSKWASSIHLSFPIPSQNLPN